MKIKTIHLFVIAIILSLFIFILLMLDSGIINFGEKEKAEEKIVTKIIDGDTVIIEGGENVRLLGIDTDEKGEKCYSAAKKRITELILNQKVKVEKDIEDKDQYDRLLRWIFLNETNINLQLVKEGLAVARFENKDIKYKEEIQQAEQNAINNKIGCKWQD